MTKRERMMAVMNGQQPDHIPASFWFHFGGEEAQGDACVQAHLKFYRETDIDFLKIMSDRIGYPLRITVDKASDWAKLAPLPRDDAFFTDSVARCRAINDALAGECCTFYTLFSPFNVVREREVFTERAQAGRSLDETLMAHLREDEAAVVHAMTVIGLDMAHLARRVIREGGCDGVYQSVQGAEHGRMTAEAYARIVRPTEIPIFEAANEASPYTIMHMCSWAGNANQLSFWQDYPARVKNWGIGIEGLSLTDGLQFFPGSVLMGGLDNRRTHPLVAGDKAALQAATRAVLDEMAGTPFILSADCTIPPDTNWDHVRWVIEEVRK